MARPRKHPQGTTPAEIQRAYRRRMADAGTAPVRIALAPEIVQALDRAAAPGESRSEVVARLVRAVGDQVAGAEGRR